MFCFVCMFESVCELYVLGRVSCLMFLALFLFVRALVTGEGGRCFLFCLSLVLVLFALVWFCLLVVCCCLFLLALFLRLFVLRLSFVFV